jgi:hypothetical protein
MKLSRSPMTLVVALAAVLMASVASAQVGPGTTIDRENSSKVANLVSPGNYALVKLGMSMKIVPSVHLEWPPPYKAATEQYSSQVMLTPGGNIRN